MSLHIFACLCLSLPVFEERRSFGGDGRVLGFDASFDHEATCPDPELFSTSLYARSGLLSL
jgi:hypothetical protein